MTRQVIQHTIYVGSLWHRDCDAFATVIGFEKANVQSRLDELAQEEYDRCMDVPDDEQTEVNIMTGGVFEETFEDIMDLGFDADIDTYELETEGLTVI